jgi:hypothetical protein
MYDFKSSDIGKISEVLGSKAQIFENSSSWQIQNKQTGQALVLTIYNNIELSDEIHGSVISVQTQHGFFELHDCTGYIVFDPDEIIFVQAGGQYVSSLIIGRECTCSMYSNINRDILNSDFTELDSALLPAAMQLSLTENLLI